MRKFFPLFLLIVFTTLQTGAQSRKELRARAKANATIEQNLRTHIGFLASDDLEGRRTGTPGEAKAAAFLADYYTRLGIQPVSGHSHQLPFEVNEGVFPASGTHYEINDIQLEPVTDLIPLPWSHLGTAIQGSAFVNVHEANTPWWFDIAPVLEENKTNPHFMADQVLRDKAKEVAAKGAKALLVYNSGNMEDGIRYSSKDNTETVHIPVYFLTSAGLKKSRLLEESSAYSNLTTTLAPKIKTGLNVAAYLDNGAPYTVILGAHYDHLGYGEDGNSRHAGEPSIHNGADDNASGTAVLMELARLLSQHKKSVPVNVLFLHFSGEELGLYGSKYYTSNPLLPFAQVSYMINMDMVGRLNAEKTLTIGGVGTSPAWGNLIPQNTKYGLTYKVDSSGSGPSDHTSFYRMDLPVLFFFTGLHTDYHKPGDDANLINYKGATDITNTIYDVVMKTPRNEKLVFTKTAERSMGTGTFRVSIGIMPDYTFSGTGIKADGVIDNRPAKKAGVETGDIIVQLGEHLITSMETYMQALNRFNKGESTTVTVKRGDKILEFPITF